MCGIWNWYRFCSRGNRRWLDCQLYAGDKEHEFACAGCSEVFLQVGEDKEMEVKEEYRGKIIYQDEDTKEHLAMWVMFKSSNLG